MLRRKPPRRIIRRTGDNPSAGNVVGEVAGAISAQFQPQNLVMLSGGLSFAHAKLNRSRSTPTQSQLSH
jgi:hypothetical protein